MVEVTQIAFEALKDRVARVETAQAVKGATDKAIETRLDKIENSIVWLTRTIMGAIVLAIIGFVVSGGANVV